MTMEQLGRLIREHWESTSDTDPKHAAKEILGKLREHEWESALLNLIAHAYSNQLSREGTRKRTRHNPGYNNRIPDKGVLWRILVTCPIPAPGAMKRTWNDTATKTYVLSAE